jgi:hypothetical protein
MISGGGMAFAMGSLAVAPVVTGLALGYVTKIAVTHVARRYLLGANKENENAQNKQWSAPSIKLISNGLGWTSFALIGGAGGLAGLSVLGSMKIFNP